MICGGIKMKRFIEIFNAIIGFIFLILGIWTFLLPLTSGVKIFKNSNDLTLLLISLGLIFRYISLLSKGKSERILQILKDFSLLVAIESFPVILMILFNISRTNNPIKRLIIFLLSVFVYMILRFNLGNSHYKYKKGKRNNRIFSKRKHRRLRALVIGIIGILILFLLIMNLIKHKSTKETYKDYMIIEYSNVRINPTSVNNIYDTANKKISPILLKQDNNDIKSKFNRDIKAYERLISNEEIDLTIKKIQKSLIDKGYSPGIVDGVWGPKTKKALEDFQRNYGLFVNGEINIRTLKELGIME